MKISIIVPVYNVKPYLKRCIDSILNQTFEEFELILVDDGSTDGSELICDKYSDMDKRVRVIHKKNGGQSDARNKGIDIAKGDWYTFIDSDDWIEKKYLEILYSNAEKYNVDISAVNYCRAYEDGSTGSYFFIDEGIHTGTDALKYLYIQNPTYTNAPFGKLYRASLFSDLRFPKGKLYEDALVAHKLIYKAKYLYFSNECMYFYFQRSGSTTKTFTINRTDEYEVFIERRKFFEEKNMKELYIQNEKARLSAIKSLTKNMCKNHVEKSVRDYWFDIFKDDIKNNISQYTNDNLKDIIANGILIKSPYLYYIMDIIKRVLMRVK